MNGGNAQGKGFNRGYIGGLWSEWGNVNHNRDSGLDAYLGWTYERYRNSGLRYYVMHQAGDEFIKLTYNDDSESAVACFKLL